MFGGGVGMVGLFASALIGKVTFSAIWRSQNKEQSEAMRIRRDDFNTRIVTNRCDEAGRKPSLATENLLEDTDGLRRPTPPRKPSVTSRCGSLRPSMCADVHYIDDVIAIEGAT